MPMTPQQRSAAAYKAAATRRAKLLAQRGGFAPPPPPRRPNPSFTSPPPPPPPPATWAPTSGRAFSTPKPTLEVARATVLVALEDLYALHVAQKGKTPEMDAAFDKYQKVLTKALGPVSSVEMQNEADTALRQAALTLVRLTF
jgi:hypothetical protein